MILIATFLTVLIETVFLALVGLRKKEQLPVIVLVNIVSNVVLNILLMILPLNFNYFLRQGLTAVIVLEATIVFSEYFVYRAAFGDLKRLFVKTLLANLISVILGGAILYLLSSNNVI